MASRRTAAPAVPDLLTVQQAEALVSEREWQQTVVDYARAKKWSCFHPFDSRHSAAGFPDLVLVRERIVFAELKREKGKVSAEQRDWQIAIMFAKGEYYLWRPSDWGEVEQVLA